MTELEGALILGPLKLLKVSLDDCGGRGGPREREQGPGAHRHRVWRRGD